MHFSALGGALRRIARLRGVEWLGRETRVLLDMGGHLWEARGSASSTFVHPRDPRAGERIWIELDRAALRWFDAQGTRLRAPSLAAVDTAEPLPTLALEDEPGARGLKVAPEESGMDHENESDLPGHGQV